MPAGGARLRKDRTTDGSEMIFAQHRFHRNAGLQGIECARLT